MSDKPGPARILVVDDEPLVRELVREVLVREGYAVWHADTAEQALALVSSRELDGPPDLLVTDLTMPGMDGVTLARTLRTTAPALMALLMSGSAAEYHVDVASDEGPFVFLQKPFSIATLKKAVKKALASREE